MPFLRDKQGRLICKDGSLVENAQKGRSMGKRATVLEGGKRLSHLKVDRILGASGPLREEYEKLLENPNTLLKDLAAWFCERGHHVNRTAISLHRRRHLQQFSNVREAAKLAATFCGLMRKHGVEGDGLFVDAAQGRFQMLLMQDLFDLKDKPALSAGEWKVLAKAMKDAVATHRDMKEVRAEYEQRARSAQAEQLDESEKGKRLVARMKEILGV